MNNSDGNNNFTTQPTTVRHCTQALHSTPTRGNRIYCVPYIPCVWQQILNNLNDLVDIVSGNNANSFNDLVNVTRGSTPHESTPHPILVATPDVPLAVYKTIARRHQAFRNQYQIIYPG